MSSVLQPPQPSGSLLKWAQDMYAALALSLDVNGLAKWRREVSGLGQLTGNISDPPTQSEVQAIQDKVNRIISLAGG